MSMTSRVGCHCQGGGQTWTRSLWMNSPFHLWVPRLRLLLRYRSGKINNPFSGKLNIVLRRLGLVFYSTALVMHILVTELR
jgi:hypothetical protein